MHCQQGARICSRSARAAAWGTRRSRLSVVQCHASSSPFKVQLLHPVKVPDADTRPLLVFLPGTDGTGQAITPQMPGLLEAGYDIRTLYIPPDDRSGWEQLQAQVLYLLSTVLAARPAGPHNVQVTLMAESFGGCLALRIAAAAPQLVKAMVLLNPATSYNQSLSGLSSFVSATNLLGLFPQDLYNTAQAVLLPFLVDMERVGPEGAQALRSMIFMEPPPDFETAASLQMDSLDDAEQDAAALTLAAARRRLQVNSSATFTTPGPQGSRASSPAAGSPGLPGQRRGSSSSSSGGLTQAAAAMGVFAQAAGGAGWGGGSVFAPAAAANFRANLMRSGNLPDAVLRDLEVPTLIVSSAKDRMLPSIAEGARLARLLPHSRRVILPDSGHAALLERGMDLAAVMRGSGISPTSIGPTLLMRRGGGIGSSSSSSGTGFTTATAVKKPVLLNVVQDDQAVPGSRGGNGSSVPPRPATLFPPEAGSRAPSPSSPAVAATAAAAAGSRAPSPPPAAAEAASAVISSAVDAGDSSSSSSSRTAMGGGSSSRRSSQPSSRSSSVSSSMEDSSEGGGQKDLAWDEWSQYLAPWRDLVSPVLMGQEHLSALVGSSRPLLFCGNHQKMGLYDMPLLAYELYVRGFKVRGLAHPGHWGGPLGPFFEKFGAVKAGPMTAYKLLKANEQVLLFPGGAREVNKRVGEEYTLLWKDSPDFVRLAARCNAIIVPFAAVGADDAYDVVMEVDDLLNAPLLGGLLKGALQRVDPSLDPKEAALPLTRLPGLGLPTPVPVPNLQRLYFKVCAPIDTQQLGLNVKGDASGWQALYDDIKATVVAGMEELLEVRAADDQRQVGARIQKAMDSWLPALSITKQSPSSPPGGSTSTTSTNSSSSSSSSSSTS